MGFFSGKSQRRAYMDVEEMLRETQIGNNEVLAGNRDASLNELGRGYRAAAGNYKNAIGQYKPYANTGKSAFNLMADAYGVNGQEKADAARGAFKESPGYQYQVDQATDAVARKASALGALGSGNTMQAVSDRAQNMADQEWGDWISGLNNLGQYGFNATGAQANLMQGLGTLRAQEGRDKSNIYNDFAKSFVNNNYSAVTPLAGYRMGISNAGSQASANAWGLGMNLGKMALGFLGGM